MDFQSIINGRAGIGLAYFLGKTIPVSQGERLARWAGRRLAARQDLAMVRAVRANQWIVRGEKLSAAELDRAVAETYAHNALTIYQFYRNFQDPLALQNLVVLPEKVSTILQESVESRRGLIVLGIHMGNFDLVMQSVMQRARQIDGFKAMFLGVPQPGKGYEWQNEFRRRNGVEVTPTSIAAIKLATQRLEEGWVIVTGLDRPINDLKYRPRFFRRPASLPVLFVTMGLRARAPVIVMGSTMLPDKTYEVVASQPISLQPYDNRQQELVANAEGVLAVAEEFIRLAPSQWSMAYPVWPEALNEVPCRTA